MTSFFPKGRFGTSVGNPEVGSRPQPGVSIPGLPLLHHKPLWQRCSYQSLAAVWKAARGQEANQRGLDRLSQRREKLNY